MDKTVVCLLILAQKVICSRIKPGSVDSNIDSTVLQSVPDIASSLMASTWRQRELS